LAQELAVEEPGHPCPPHGHCFLSSGLMHRALRPKSQIVEELVRLATQKDFRSNRKRCVVAGTKLIRDLGQRYPFHELLYSKDHEDLCRGIRAEAKYLAEPQSLRRIAQLREFDGLVGTLDLPESREDMADLRLLLVLDYIEDAGLLGTLLRTAVAFQWQAVYFLPNTVDPFDPLCIRASQGALFEIPHRRGSMAELQKLCKARRLPLCVSHSEGTDIGSAAYQPPQAGMAQLLREEYAAPWGVPRRAVKIRVPDPWLHSAERPEEAFEPRALDVAVAGGILMHHIKYFNYPQVSQSPFLASPK